MYKGAYFGPVALKGPLVGCDTRKVERFDSVLDTIKDDKTARVVVSNTRT